ncbi:hypothetical protein [Tropicimonas isoalkanivorans]|uniref:DUF2188 domain-containing protein n=1 Tax=Tropicimonas isoalkanivorans TaxID=441112 RepID=A0A1I1M3T1_9RHOB|nr:hypothetical protein [Tropicimonas isoalkanivorans]SFC77858.1 hypothetical protein SAMN04488094_10965 [Tropicimonas isoalkanivorans]
MSYTVRVLPNGDGLWLVTGYDPEPFTVSLAETFDEALEDATRFCNKSGYSFGEPAHVVAFPDIGRAAQ